MELVLTQADLDAMPAELRQELFLYLAGAGGGALGKTEGAVLSREQAIALLREVSFHRAGARLRAVLDRLAYSDAARPPSKKRMTDALGEDSVHLGGDLATLNRMTAKVMGYPGARLCKYDRTADAYTADAATREILRELLVTMKASGKLEEPLWE